MQIKNVKSEQFAGVHNIDVSFQPGLNIIRGANGAGKSTIINIVSSTLFQPVNLKFNTKNDSAFHDLYFPTEPKEGKAGDCIDGTVVFSTASGDYTLRKDWGSGSGCKLTLPNGSVIKSGTEIDRILAEEFVFGAPLYNRLLLQPQASFANVLRDLLGGPKDDDTVRRSLSDAVTLAFADSDTDVSTDRIGEKIEERIDALGKRWDSGQGRPEGQKGGARRVNGIGELVRAYYAVEDAANEMDVLSDLENDVDQKAKRLDDCTAAAAEAEAKKEAFEKAYTALRERAAARDRLAEKESARSENRAAANAWPELEATRETAKRLRDELAARKARDLLDAADSLKEKREDKEKQLAALGDVAESDVSGARDAEKKIERLRTQLSAGPTLTAALELQPGYESALIEYPDGRRERVSNGEETEISGAAAIEIPGVMRLRLAPKGVDAEALRGELEAARARLSEILSRYAGIGNADELAARLGGIQKLRAEIDALKKDYDRAVPEESAYEEAVRVCEAYGGRPLRSKAEIDAEIAEKLDGASPSDTVLRAETKLNGYRDRFGSLDALRKAISDCEAEIASLKGQIEAAGDIPEEFTSTGDPDALREKLAKDAKLAQSLKEDALSDYAAAVSNLSGSSLSGKEAKEAWEKRREKLDALKEELANWTYIKERYDALREQLTGSPLKGLADRFAANLERLSDGKFEGIQPDQDSLDLVIYGGGHKVTYETISEGYKECVALAYRAAVVDYLYPDGGGVLALDDPCTDMDAERGEKAWALIEDCAARHQVIVMTCTEPNSVSSANTITL